MVNPGGAQPCEIKAQDSSNEAEHSAILFRRFHHYSLHFFDGILSLMWMMSSPGPKSGASSLSRRDRLQHCRASALAKCSVTDVSFSAAPHAHMGYWRCEGYHACAEHGER